MTMPELLTEIVEMHYSEYKNNYPDCETVPDSYNKKTKTIEVYIHTRNAKGVLLSVEDTKKAIIEIFAPLHPIDATEEQKQKFASAVIRGGLFLAEECAVKSVDPAEAAMWQQVVDGVKGGRLQF